MVVGVCLSGVGCASAGIALREQLGIAKREQLVDRVKDARDSQEAAKEQFASALEEFLSVTGQTGKGGALEAKYNRLNSSFKRSESKAEAVRERIGSVETVADKLFREWRKELDQYTDERLRDRSEEQLAESQSRYAQLIGVMKAAAGKMDPVLASLRDQVLYLKHNLNAQAIAGLQGTAVEVENDISELIREMEASIAEANAFIEQMQPEG
jgi:chromosome segregation ATPase